MVYVLLERRESMLDFTNRVKKILKEFAVKEAKRLGHDYLGPEHILLGILKAEDSVAVRILMNLGVDLQELRKEVEKRCEQSFSTFILDPQTQEKYQRIISYAREEAKNLKHSYVGSEHLLLALLREQDSIPAAALATFNVTYSAVQEEILHTLGLSQESLSSRRVREEKKMEKTPTLDEFARDLTKAAREGLLDPVIGRDREIERVIQILCRKTKNNPVLVGEAGVGKTAIVEGLAQRIVEKKVPDLLQDKRVMALDIAALVAGTKYRGEFEDRMKKIIKEVKNSKNVILFIDELHTIIGAGAAEGAVDAANILKPPLSRGEIQCIGATTLKEYKKFIERDSALERRFQMVQVEEPSVEDTIEILKGLRKSYEKHHKVEYTEKSLEEAARLAARYITDRNLPDKAIDIIDEAGARTKLKRKVIPEEVEKLEKKIQELSRLKNEKVRLQEFEEAARLRDQIRTLELQAQQEMRKHQEKEEKEKPRITEQDIREVVSIWTGIPLSQLEEEESTKLLRMEEELSKKIIGQKEAIKKLASSVRRARMGIRSPNRPAGSFLFLGPTGVGKTETAKALAEFLFGSKDSLIQIDMSEYMEPHSVAKLIGAPPGYVGYHEGGQLTEKVRRKPYSVILFDEVEKAHPEVYNILLQILDEGRLTDTSGNKVSFKDAIIIMTSNIGARELQKGGKIGFEEDQKEHKEEKIREELKRHFNPEFLNRIDEIIVFEPLTKEDVEKIASLLIEELNRNLLEKNIYVEIDKRALKELAERGYDEKFGARPLRRVLEKEIEDKIAIFMIEKKIEENTKVEVSYDPKKKEFLFHFKEPSQEELKRLKEEYGISSSKKDTKRKEEKKGESSIAS